MTDKELVDAAWAELAQTTKGWTQVQGYPAATLAGTHWGRGKALLDRIGVVPPPPPGNLLRWAPPVLQNPLTINYVPGVVQQLDDSKDYIVAPFDVTVVASKTGGARTDGGFRGGRHIVMLGGRMDVTNTNNRDDACLLQFQAGDPTGVIHMEGVDFARTVNAVTVRTGRTVRVQNCRLSNNATYQHDHGFVHPDIVQIWATIGSGKPRIQMHRVTALSDMTFLSCLEDNPTSWEAYDVQLAPAFSTAGDGIYPETGGSPHNLCKYTLGNVWFKPANGKLDDHWGYTDHNEYLLISADGSRQWASGPNKVGGSAGATSIGGSQGDVWRCTEGGAGLYGQEVRYGTPPGGDFCPAGVPGVNYVSPGYV